MRCFICLIFATIVYASESEVVVTLTDGRTLTGEWNPEKLTFTQIIGKSPMTLHLKAEQIVKVEPSSAALQERAKRIGDEAAAKQAAADRIAQERQQALDARLAEIAQSNRQRAERDARNAESVKWLKEGFQFDPETMTVGQMRDQVLAAAKRKEEEAEHERGLARRKARDEQIGKELLQEIEENRERSLATKKADSQRELALKQREEAEAQAERLAAEKLRLDLRLEAEERRVEAEEREHDRKIKVWAWTGVIALLVALYHFIIFIPYFVARSRRHPHLTPLLWVNIAALFLPPIWFGLMAWAEWPFSNKSNSPPP